jgi:hypothetical protein
LSFIGPLAGAQSFDIAKDTGGLEALGGGDTARHGGKDFLHGCKFNYKNKSTEKVFSFGEENAIQNARSRAAIRGAKKSPAYRRRFKGVETKNSVSSFIQPTEASFAAAVNSAVAVFVVYGFGDWRVDRAVEDFKVGRCGVDA